MGSEGPTRRTISGNLPLISGEATGGGVLSAVRQFGKYFLVRKIAEGGMAEIFLAKQIGAEGFERNVVIKRMLQHVSAVPDFVTMFLDEARLAARLAHPNIVQINDLGLADGSYYICMEYLAGEDFSTVLRASSRRREYVPLAVVLRVVAEAAHGLHFAHEFADDQGNCLNIVHRDVSPSNLYVTYQGQVKVLDFGIAKAESRVTNTTAGVVKGKYMYMSPEQARGVTVDRRSDVFALGICLYEALTHVRPFARDADLAILNAVLECDFKPPRELRADLSSELEAVLLKAMALRVEDRYQSAREFALDLEGFIAATSSSAGGTQVASYMRQSFGEERYAEKSRIPTLDSLAAAGVDVPGFSNPLAPRTDPGPSSPATLPRVPRRELLVGLVAFALVVAVAGAALLFTQRSTRPPEVSVAAVSTVVPAPVVVAAPPAPPVVDSGSVEPVPTKVAAVKATAVRPIVLTTLDVQRVINRSSGVIARCFEQHKQEIGPQGQVNVRLTIARSGKVKQAAMEGEVTALGRCIEGHVRAMKFPEHKDEEVTLTVPFAYEVK